VTTGAYKRPIIAIGWDVRGWRSRDQAVAVAAFDSHSSNLNWLGVSGQFQFVPYKPLSLSSLIEPAVGSQLAITDLEDATVVVGIDAPLAFPIPFMSLLRSNNAAEYYPPDKEINNSFAYRDCEKWIFEQFSKKPLSATFDKLGNNATLAMCMANSLKSEGFQLIPQEVTSSDHAVIEVYPGIVKRGQKKSDRVIGPVERHIPTNLVPGTDQYDAAICAILAATFAGRGADLGLPDLVGPESTFDLSEGWIYGLPADYVRAESR